MQASPSFDIICIGSAIHDVFVNLPDTDAAFVRSNHLILSLGAKINVDYPTVEVGGGGTNSAVNFALQGLKTGILSRIAQDEAGSSIAQRLAQRGVETSLLQKDDSAEAKTGTSIILNVPGKDRTVLVNRGVSHQLDFDNLDWERLKQAKWIYVASFGSRSPDADFIRLGDFAVANGIHIAFNPGMEQIKRGAKALGRMITDAQILIMNLTEAALLTESSPKDRVTTIVERLKALGPKLVVITNGRNGVFAAMDTGERYFVAPPTVPIVCTLGAGDAFGSTVTASIIRDGWDLPKALERAAMNAALVVQHPGAQIGIQNLDALDEQAKSAGIQVQELSPRQNRQPEPTAG